MKSVNKTRRKINELSKKGNTLILSALSSSGITIMKAAEEEHKYAKHKSKISYSLKL